MCSWFMVGGRPVRRRGSADRSCKQNYPDVELGKQARPAILHTEDYACCIFQFLQAAFEIGMGGGSFIRTSHYE